jgi:hypothetical protein
VRRWHVRWAIFDVLDQIAPQERPKVLQDIAERIFAPKTLVNAVSLIAELRQKKNKYEEFTDEKLNLIKQGVAQRIKNAAANGEISEKSDSISASLYAWRQWGDVKEAESFASVTATDEKLIRFLDNFIYTVNSAALSDRVMTSTNRLAMMQLSESLDVNALYGRLSQMQIRKLNEADRNVAEFTLKQLTKMREKGLTPEQFDNNRLDLD